MLKRTMLILMALAMVLVCVPGVQAAETSKISVETVDRMENVVVLDRYQVMAQQLSETAWVLPDQSVYGKAVVVGDTMSLPVFVCTKGMSGSATLAMLIYEGTYESGALDNKPVYADTMTVRTDAEKDQETFYWPTSGYAQGDYTVVFGIIDGSGKAVFAYRADIYLSNVEIPMTGIDMFILEMDDTPDSVTVARDATFSAIPFYEPYHTTSNRDYTVTGDGLETTHSYLLDIGNRYSVANLKGNTVTMRCGGFTDSVKFQFKNKNELVHFAKNSAHICKDNVSKIEVMIPDAANDGVEIKLYNGNSKVADVENVQGNTLTVRGVQYGYGMIWLRHADSWDTVELHVADHEIKDEVQKPTCTERGYVYHNCIHCDYSESTILEPLGHQLDKETEVILTAPTATRDGESKGFCTRCNKEVHQTVSRIFTDTRGDRFYSDPVDYCYANKIINGVTDTLFKPRVVMNRAMLVTMLYRYAGEPEVSAQSAYTDVPTGRYFTDAVAWATETKITDGFPDGTFKPLKPITREQFVTMIFRFAQAQDKDNGQRADLSEFEDQGEISKFAAEAVQWSVANKILNGVTSTEIMPQKGTTRAQSATLLYRAIMNVLTENS